MKIKGENEEQVEEATQIRDCNLEILSQLKAFISEGKAWPAAEGDDETDKATKKRYKEKALAGVDMLAAELKSTEAGFYLAKGSQQPMINARLLHGALDNAKAKDRPELEDVLEKLETAIHTFLHGGGKPFTYRRMVPKYEFKRIENV